MKQQLLIFDEIFANGFRTELLDLSSFSSILSAILVITSKNPVVSVLCLIGLFLSISCYLIILGANFVGLSYILVYVGAVSILFLFILMLINVRISELLSDTNKSIPLAIIIAVSINYSIYQMLPYGLFIPNNYTFVLGDLLNNVSSGMYDANNTNPTNGVFNNDKLSFVTSKTWEGNLSETDYIISIGNIMYTSYFVWLLITSIILLLAMVGTIIITIKQKN